MSRKKRPNRYSNQNPPADEGTAQKRLDVLVQEISFLGTDLDHREPDSFDTDKQYAQWRRRATRALGHMRAERDYLEKCIERFQGGLTLPEIAAEIRRESKRMAAHIEAEYSPLYSTTTPPPDLGTANLRQAELMLMRRRIEAACREVASQWQQHALNRKDLSGVKAPLTSILDQVVTEHAAIKASKAGLHKKAQAGGYGGAKLTWKQTCLQALDRAVSEGFDLTEREQEVQEGLRGLVNKD